MVEYSHINVPNPEPIFVLIVMNSGFKGYNKWAIDKRLPTYQCQGVALHIS